MEYETIRFIAVLATAFIIGGCTGFYLGFSIGSEIADELTIRGDGE